MAAFDVTEKYKMASAVVTTEGRQLRRVFQLKFILPTSPVLVVLDPGVPNIGGVHNFDLQANCVRITSAAIDGTRTIWNVFCDYQTPDATGVDKIIEDDPLNDEPIKAWTSFNISEVVDSDKDGFAILNSAGYEYSPAMMQDVDYLRLTVSRNESVTSYDPATARDYINAVNSDSVTMVALPATAKQIKCLEYSARTATRGDSKYLAITYVFVFASLNWSRQVLDAGIYEEFVHPETHEVSDRRIRIDGEPTDSPVKLNGAGQALPSGEEPVYLEFDINKQMPFGALGIPTTF